MKPWTGDVALHPFGQEASNRDCEIRELDSWLENRPSATMDPCFGERERKIYRLRELRSQARASQRQVRRPTNMMAAQQMSEFDVSDLP